MEEGASSPGVGQWGMAGIFASLFVLGENLKPWKGGWGTQSARFMFSESGLR